MTTKKEIPCFSLTCMNCDAGSEFTSRNQAVSAGWKDIHRDDGPSWNDLGMCPDCQVDEARNAVCSLARSVFNAVDPSEWRCHRRWPKETKRDRDPKYIYRELLSLSRDLHAANASKEKLRRFRERHAVVAPATEIAG